MQGGKRKLSVVHFMTPASRCRSAQVLALRQTREPGGILVVILHRLTPDGSRSLEQKDTRYLSRISRIPRHPLMPISEIG